MTTDHCILSRQAFRILDETVKPITFREIPEITLRYEIPES